MKTLFKPTSYKKGAALAIGATFVWKVISFANALLLALYFGASRQTDVYFYLIMLTGFGIVFLQRLNQQVLIPEAMFLDEQHSTQGRQFATMWLYIYVVSGCVIGIIGTCWPEKIGGLLSRFGGQTLAQDKALLSCALWVFAFQIITYYLIALAEMYKFFKTAWLGILNALCPLVALLLLGDEVGIISMLYGFLMANALQILILLTLLKTQLQWKFVPTWVPLRTRTKQNMLAGQTLALVELFNSLLPVYLITGMGAGLISALNYCRQLTDSPTEIITARTANVAKIEMTACATRNHQNAFNETFKRLNHVLLIVLLPLVIFSCYFAPQIVDLFFQRGQFDARAAHNTVAFLRPMLFTIVLLIPAYVTSNTTAAWQKIKESFPYALGTSAGFLVAIALLLPVYGAFSFPYISIGGLLVGFVVNYFFFRKHFPFVAYMKLFEDMGKLALVNGIALLPAVLVQQVYSFSSSFVTLLTCGSIFMVGYILLLNYTKDGPQFLREIKQVESSNL